MTDNELINHAITTLKANDCGLYTQPAKSIYPHQWLWDSCFIAIGLANVDIKRAKKELTSLLRGQWHNGMMPSIIFRDGNKYRLAREQWRSWLSPYAPNDTATSGITQPPALAEAVVRIGQKLPTTERELWYKSMYPSLLAYHRWLYKERDPHGEGLLLQIHPWETGLDNSPPWMAELHEHLMPLWIRALEKSGLSQLVRFIRTDTRKIPIKERSSASESIALFDASLRLRRKSYDINKILDHGLFSIEDLTFNSIFIRANDHLIKIAKTINEEVPEGLIKSIKKSKVSYDQLWDESSSSYYCRDFVTHNLIKTQSIAALMPLYSGAITSERAEKIVQLIKNKKEFKTSFPIPTVPLSSPWFNQQKYWQGPTWVNTNWLIIDGLNRYGYKQLAEEIRSSTIKMIKGSGFYEYFDPLNGKGLGINNFSWTAALAIDLVKR